MQLFDTHAHLDQADFDADRAEVIARARDAGVESIISIGTTAATSAVCVRLAAEYTGVFAAVGMQPNYIAEADPGDWDHIVALAGEPGVVAIVIGTSRHSTCSRIILIGTCGSRRNAGCRLWSTCVTATTTSWRCCVRPASVVLSSA
jgi:Tat protein secretion system quality control protein TatD with DNase activity